MAIPHSDRTHDQRRRSWVDSANDAATDFPLQNLPYGVFRRARADPRIGVAIGNDILDLAAFADRSSPGDLAIVEAFKACTLNPLMSLAPEKRKEIRDFLSQALDASGAAQAEAKSCLVPQSDVEMLLPAKIGDYTDFYASVFHATNVGAMFRPDNPLLPNYKYIPIGYHGRASSVIPGGVPVRRPNGQIKPKPDAPPVFAACRQLDYEAEMGFFVAGGNALGEPVPVGRAAERIFGLCLLNDWSARDIQGWEYQPLGPFLSKSFATTISPWVVTAEALAPFRVPAFKRPEGDPAPLPYLHDDNDAAQGGFDVRVEVYLNTTTMRAKGMAPHRMSQGNSRDLYWTAAQMLAHHASNGCNLRSGDLYGSGTISGREGDSLGSLLELTKRGQQPLSLPSGEKRGFLEDGDEIIMRGRCERPGFVGIGFGECRAIVQPAPAI